MNDSCQHESWGVDSQGQHWCLAPDCHLMHNFPHSRDQRQDDCGHVQDIYLAAAFGGEVSPLLILDQRPS